MDLRINHLTQYTYSEPVNYALQKLRLRPASSDMQTVLDWSIEITGGQIEASYRDHYGNHVDLVRVEPGATEVQIRALGQVRTLSATGVLGHVYGRAPLWHFRQPSPLTMPGQGIKALPKLPEDPLDQLPALHALSATILETLPYKTGLTSFGTPAEEALQGSSGVCQDHAHIFVAAARHSGLPARYVSGYLMMDDQADQDATHAWAEVCIEGLGWVGFDVSNGMSPDERYIRTAIGRDARDAAPIEGLRIGQGDESLSVSLQVQQ